ncbi:acyltransferase [Spirosoma sp. KCTC 42546]|uniref:acyltransferase family protein n=1 Tax=Spirosoma sp. KCTC 42546 TaxID=2520506 RepID=UPI0011575CA4|nr:acyltransferase [Spirosoma sp. KCTC 42546]QDK79671.1 acyltransferase [Spirosoma sp. KCTC 42546]
MPAVRNLSLEQPRFLPTTNNGTVSWPLLSVTRFVLAFVVFTSHAKPHVGNDGPLAWINKLGAFEAIMGFLLISGLSIGKSLGRNQSNYFKRRAQRIYPVYLASLVLFLAVNFKPFSFESILAIVFNVLFLNQILTSTSIIGPAWTLALEVWLYCLAPVLIKLSYRTLLIIVYSSFLLFCIYTCCRTLLHFPYYSGISFGINLPLLSFIWIIGFMLAVFRDKHRVLSMHVGIIFILYLLMTFGIMIGFQVKNHIIMDNLLTTVSLIIGKTVCLLSIYYVVLIVGNQHKLSVGTTNSFNLLGNISYPLYLTHGIALTLCDRIEINNWILLSLAALILAFLVYWIFDFYAKKRIEKPDLIAAS